MTAFLQLLPMIAINNNNIFSYELLLKQRPSNFKSNTLLPTKPYFAKECLKLYLMNVCVCVLLYKFSQIARHRVSQIRKDKTDYYYALAKARMSKASYLNLALPQNHSLPKTIRSISSLGTRLNTLRTHIVGMQVVQLYLGNGLNFVQTKLCTLHDALNLYSLQPRSMMHHSSCGPHGKCWQVTFVGHSMGTSAQNSFFHWSLNTTLPILCF